MTEHMFMESCTPLAGHGGPNAADFVRNNLFDSLLSNSKFPEDIKAALGEQQAPVCLQLCL